MAMRITSAGKWISTIPANGTHFTLEELQAAVGGDIQIVSIDNAAYPEMIVHENGLNEDLPLNAAATMLYKRGAIVGDVLLCRPGEIE